MEWFFEGFRGFFVDSICTFVTWRDQYFCSLEAEPSVLVKYALILIGGVIQRSHCVQQGAHR